LNQEVKADGVIVVKACPSMVEEVKVLPQSRVFVIDITQVLTECSNGLEQRGARLVRPRRNREAEKLGCEYDAGSKVNLAGGTSDTSRGRYIGARGNAELLHELLGIGKGAILGHRAPKANGDVGAC